MQSRRRFAIDGLVRVAYVSLMFACTMCSAEKKTSGVPPVVTSPSGDPQPGVVPEGQNIGETPSEKPLEPGTPEVPQGPQVPPCATGTRLMSLAGSVTDELGGGKAEALIQLCLRFINPKGVEQSTCRRPLPAGADGSFELAIADELQCLREATLHVFVPGASLADAYLSIPLTADSARLHLPKPIVLFATQPPLHLPTGASTQPVTVDFDEWLSVDLVPDDCFGEDYVNLSSRRLTASEAGLGALPGGILLDHLWGFAPQGGVIGDGFPFRIKTGVPPGTQLRAYILGGVDCTLTDGTHIPEGQWAALPGEAVVDDLGIIEGLLPCFTWLGYGRSGR